MKAITAATLGLGLLVNTAYAQSAPAVKYSASIDIAPVTEQIPTVQHGQTMQYIVDPKTEPVVQVSQYDVQIWMTPFATLANIADDVLVQYIPVQLTGPNPNLTREGEHTRTMVAPTTEGTYALYTEFKADGQIAETRSYHRFIVTAEEPAPTIPFVPDKSEVDAWLAAGIESTNGGVFNPRYNSTFVPEKQIVQYEDKAHFAVLGTPGYVDGVKQETDPCKPADPCVAPLQERLYVSGAPLDSKVINAAGTDTTVTQIQPGQELVAQYTGEDLNMRTHITEGEQTRINGDLTSLTRRIAGHSVIPNIGGMFAVEAVLWGIVGVDKNHDSQITPDEQDCVPIAWKTQYVQFVPKGHEGAAFLGGLVLGAAGGYLLSSYGGGDSGPFTFPEFPIQGTYDSGREGSTVR